MKKLTLLFFFVVTYIVNVAAANLVVGEPQGVFSLSPSGAAIYTIGIECPSGINGMEPGVSLVYNSQSGLGAAGWGWNIGGTSVIAKTCPSIYYDGFVRSINYDNSANYLTLDGQRLVMEKKISDTETEFRTENDNLNRIIRNGANGDFSFVVYTTAGRQMTYSQLKTGADFYNGNLGWYLTEVKDLYGNYMTYSYTAKTSGNNIMEVTIDKISYGGNKTLGKAHCCEVRFEYENRNADSYYIDGYEKTVTQQLTNITTYSNNQAFRKYQLSYQASTRNRAQLISIKVSGSNEDYYNDIKIKWSSFSDEIISTSSQIGRNYKEAVNKFWIPLDYDNDGYTDLIGIYYEENGSAYGGGRHGGTRGGRRGGTRSASDIDEVKRKYIYKTNLNRIDFYHNENGSFKYTTTKSYSRPIIEAQHSTAISCNFNKTDDLQKIMLYATKDKIIKAYDIDEEKSFSLGTFTNEFADKLPPYTIADFNKDGYDDIAILEAIKDKNGKYPLTIIFGANDPSFSKLYHRKSYQVELSSIPQRLYASDLNSDGCLDILILTQNGNKILSSTNMGNDGFSPNYTLDKRNETSELNGDYNKYSCIEAGDFNGDGLMDFYIDPIDKTQTPFIMKSMKNTFIKIPVKTTTRISNEAGYALAYDFDNDGRTDIVIVNNCGQTINWHRSTGNSSLDFTETKKLNSKSGQLYSHQTIIADFNSDGRMDLLSIGAPTSANGTSTTLEDKFYISCVNGSNYGGAVSYIELPINNISISYDRLSNPNIYKRSNISHTNNVSNIIAPLLVVSKIRTSDGTTQGFSTNYTYQDALVERTGKGFLGFASATSSNNNYTTTIASSLNNYPALLHTKSSILSKDNNVIKQTSITNAINLKGKCYQVRTTKQVENDLLLKTTKTITYSSYNDHNIPTAVVIDYGNKIKETTTLSDFVTNETYNICLPKKKVIEKSNADGTFSTTSTYSYTDKYDVAKSIDYVGTEFELPTTKTYDGFGNVTSVQTVPQDAEDHLTKYTYTASGRFLASIENYDKSTVTYTNDEKLCRLTKSTFKKGSLTETTTYTKYDGFNNCLETKLPDGRISKMTMAYGNAINGGKYYVEKSCPGTPTVREYHKEGKVQFVQRTGVDGRTLNQQINYNLIGKIDNKTIPYYDYRQDGRTEYKYDNYNRLIKEISPAGETSYTYEGLKTTITSPMGVKVMEYNSAGQLVKCTDNGSTISYEYYPSGLMKQATPQNGQPIKMEYDAMGNRTKLIDPDAGEIVWEYDSYGRESSKLQKKLSRFDVNSEYNEDGSLSYVSGYDWNVYYSYNSNGQLTKEINQLNNNTKIYTYDAYNRVTEVKEVIRGKSFVTKYGYAKNYGGATTVTFPSGYSIENVYNDYGYLTAVKSGNTTIWQMTDVDIHGRIIKDKVCGSVVRTREIDNAGRVWAETAYNGNTGLMNLTYDYEPDEDEGEAFSPIERKDQLTGNFDQIHYNKNKLCTFSVGNRLTGTGGNFRYDKLGNITETYDSHWTSIAYGQGGASPHQVSSVNYNSIYQPRGSRKIEFDQTFGKVKTATEAEYSYSIEYGTDGQRKLSHLSKDKKLVRDRYYLPNYELDVNSLGKTRAVHYLYGGNGLAAIYVINDGKDSLFAAATDRQGSLVATQHTASGAVERYSYKPFGGRRNPDNWVLNQTAAVRFSRGYCMHEHVPEVGLIDMNGRMYDPTLCQFVSPDPYIQDPTCWQNFNRYGYCLQNPMLYTDPTGEWSIWTAVATTLLCPSPASFNALANVYCNKESGYIQSSSDMWKCYGQGYIVGTINPAPKNIPFMPVETIIAWAARGFDGTLENSFKVSMGASYIDGDTNFWKGCWYGISSDLFETTQNSLGQLYTEAKIIYNKGGVEKINYLDGMVYATNENSSSTDGVTLGHFSNINIPNEITGDFKDYALTAHNGLYMHEYGHLYQSRNYGSLYIFYIGSQSLYSASKKDGNHKTQWYEIEASYYGKRHFTRKYGENVWTGEIEKVYPTKRR